MSGASASFTSDSASAMYSGSTWSGSTSGDRLARRSPIPHERHVVGAGRAARCRYDRPAVKPRPPKNPKAARYGRRAAVRRASGSADKLDAVVPKLLEALAKIGASKQTVQNFKRDWERSTESRGGGTRCGRSWKSSGGGRMRLCGEAESRRCGSGT